MLTLFFKNIALMWLLHQISPISETAQQTMWPINTFLNGPVFVSPQSLYGVTLVPGCLCPLFCSGWQLENTTQPHCHMHTQFLTTRWRKKAMTYFRISDSVMIWYFNEVKGSLFTNFLWRLTKVLGKLLSRTVLMLCLSLTLHYSANTACKITLFAVFLLHRL